MSSTSKTNFNFESLSNYFSDSTIDRMREALNGLSRNSDKIWMSSVALSALGSLNTLVSTQGAALVSKTSLSAMAPWLQTHIQSFALSILSSAGLNEFASELSKDSESTSSYQKIYASAIPIVSSFVNVASYLCPAYGSIALMATVLNGMQLGGALFQEKARFEKESPRSNILGEAFEELEEVIFEDGFEARLQESIERLETSIEVREAQMAALEELIESEKAALESTKTEEASEFIDEMKEKLRIFQNEIEQLLSQKASMERVYNECAAKKDSLETLIAEWEELLLKAQTGNLSAKTDEVIESWNSVSDAQKEEVVSSRNNLAQMKTLRDKMQESLDEVMIGQESAKEAVIRAISRHILTEDTDDIKKANILLLGPTGCGKTTMAKAISKALDRPFVTIDAPSLTPAGYVGSSLSECLEPLMESIKSSYDYDYYDYDKPKKKELPKVKGVVFVDEVDKLLGVNSDGGFKKQVQNELLKAIEAGGQVKIDSGWSSEDVDLSQVIFIFGGSFAGLDRSEDSPAVSLEQLEEFGVSREFIGRLSNIAELKALSSDQLKRVMNELKKGEASIQSWQKEFKNIGVSLELDADVIDQVITFAMKRRTGVRGVSYVLRELLTPILYQEMDKRSEGVSISEALELAERRVTLDDWNASSIMQLEAEKNRIVSLEDLRAELDAKVVGQEKAKGVLANAVFNHYVNMKHNLGLPKGNILMMGPSGSGKTFSMEVLAEATNIPMANFDASKVTREGFVGSSFNDALVQLLEKTNGDVEHAEKGIIFLDEIDKQFEDNARGIGGGEITGRSVQNQLLKMIQGDEISVTYKGKSKTINTKNILFVLAGSFSKFPGINQLDEVREADLIACGMTPELLGRIGYVTRLEQLTVEDYKVYLSEDNPHSLISVWKKAFKKLGAKLTITKEVTQAVIKKCMGNETGLRGLQNALLEKMSPRLAEAKLRSERGESEFEITV